ncbi:MAG: RNA-binding protein [Acetobacteraceae bacterium]
MTDGELTADVGDDPETGPIRRCIVTRERDSKERMIRFVLGPDRIVVPDLAARLPGRGMWLSARLDVLEPARCRGAFARAARGQVTVPPDLADSVRTGLSRRIAELLGLARRAGQAVAGFEKAREWVRTGRAALIVQASDGSEEERRRFLSGAGDIPVLAPLPAVMLGTVFGRDRAVHVAVAAGRLAQSLATDGERLAGVADGANRVERPGEPRQRDAEQAGQ